ncbi:MAG: hypothetical protein E7047_10180 [Lentisphaerae bacterium]|nr:hypothetical protein [Lentisphaerota bacterium]
MLKKIFLTVAALCTAAAMNASVTAKASGKGASVQQTAPGVWVLSVAPGQGWSQIQLAAGKAPQWGNGKISVTVKVLEPAGKLPGITLSSEGPRTAINSSYIQNTLKCNEKVVLTAEHKGNQPPRYISISVKNPVVPVKLEISDVKFDTAAPAALAVKKSADVKVQPLRARQQPLPPVMFKGKPFFPLGAYDTFRYDEAGKFGSIDPDFVAAGGNLTDLGIIYLPENLAGSEVYKRCYRLEGQEQFFAALEKMKNDPLWKDVAILIGLGANIMYDDSQIGQKGGHNAMFVPVQGQALEIRKQVLAETVSKLAQYPNILGYTTDEPENFAWKYYEKNHREGWNREKDVDLARKIIEWTGWTTPIIRKNHPGAQLVPIIGWWTTYEHTSPLYDVIIANAYPAKKHGMKEFEADLFIIMYDTAKMVEAARKNNKTAIIMPCMYDLRADRVPMTLNEQLYLMFAPITRGAMGIHGWRLQRCSDSYRKFVIYPAMKEVHNLKEYFLGEWLDEYVKSDHDTASVPYLKQFQERIREISGMEDETKYIVKDAVPDTSYCLRRRADGSYLFLCVNNMRTPLEVTYTFALEKYPRYMVDNINRNDRVYFNGNQIKVKFAPFGVHAYIFKP